MENKPIIKVFDKIEMISVDSIKPYFRNPRNNEETVKALVELIKEVGFNVPIVIDEEYTIIKGHSRLKAAKLLGMTEVPCIVARGVSDRQKRIDRITDNKVQELTKWIEEDLKYEVTEIDYDFSIVGIDSEAREMEVGDSDWKTPDEEDMKTAEKEKGEMLEYNQPKYKFICPYCNESFFISKEDILSEIRK